MGDLHQMIIDDVGQVVGGQLVGTLIEHLVVKDVGLHAHLTTDEVVDQYLASRLNLETDNILLTIGNQLVNLLLGQGQRVTHLPTGMGVVLEILDLSTLGLQFLGRVESDVGLIGIQQLLHIFLINVATLTLAIRTFVATEADTLVELDAQPFERLNDILLGTRHKTVGVGVLNTEHQIAAMLLGKQVIIQGGAHSANMQSPRRTRGKTYSNSSF